MLQHTRRSACRDRNQAGQVLLIGTLTGTMLFAMVGLALDTGYIYYQKRKLQSAADAAAIAAVLELTTSPIANYVQAGREDAKLNGYEHGVAGVTTTLTMPPATGPHAGNSQYVEAVVTKNVKTYFLSLLSLSSMNVTARAEAKLGAGTSCVYLLDPAAEDQFRVAGNYSANCGLMANSSSPKALNLNSGTATASRFAANGRFIGNFNPAPAINQPRVPDPLAYLQPPTFPAANYYGVNVADSTPLDPGVYHGGIRVAQGVRAFFNPGIYVLNGGGLTTSGGPNAFLTGIGVSFYFTARQPVPTPPAGFNVNSVNTPGRFLLNGEGGFDLRAPTSGEMAGILFFQDRNPANQAGPYDIQGTNTTRMEGVIYIPASDFLFQNHTGNTADYTIIVSRTLRLDGGGANLTIRNDYSSLQNGSPIKSTPVLTR
ncbi:MAG: hypothetical protein HY858_02365 [Candidatus Solibacter usitatus]|nr:hypothetical protein [Candidatus Solibacter usitatus]